MNIEKNTAQGAADTLTERQQAIVPIAALAAAGDMVGLNEALKQGLDAGLTVSMLSALPGVESQLQAHIRISMNVGLTAGQLQQLAQVLTDHVDAQSGQRAQEALRRQLAITAGGPQS